MAKIDTTQIEGYENMTAEEKLAALESYEYEDHSEEVQTLKNRNDKLSKESAEWKRKHNALLSEDERKAQEAKEERERMEQELAELRREKAKSVYKAKLLADGYDETLADASADALADGDTDTFFANQKKFIAARDKALKEELMRGTPRPGAGDGTTYNSKDEIMKITDPVARQQAIADNMHLFE